MARHLTFVLLCLCCLQGCLRRGPRNSNCQWPSESSTALDLRTLSQQRHLSEDAELAEDLAIRYADVHHGPHSGHFEGMVEYARARDQCMAGLFQNVARTHQLSETQVRQFLGRRRSDWDLAVSFSFAVLYGWSAYALAGWVNRLYPASESRLARVALILYVSVIVSLAGVWVGELWAGLMENLRVGSGHLSYRGARVPWSHHGVVLFAAGASLFWIFAAWQRRAVSGSRSSSPAAQNRLFNLNSVP